MTNSTFASMLLASLLGAGLALGGALIAQRSGAFAPQEQSRNHLPTVTADVDPVLGIPARVNRPNNALL